MKNAQLEELARNLERRSIYRSQFGQDKFIHQLLGDKEEGVFLDIGAYDGKMLSNTYFFEKYLKWKGVCVEPIPERYNELLDNRTCLCINGCVSDVPGDKLFLHVIGGDKYDVMELGEYPKIRGKEHTEMLSGLLNNYHIKHRKLIDQEIALLGGSKDYFIVKCYTINEILKELGSNCIDYLSLDTEGSELSILKSIDFNQIEIDVISVEVLYPDVPIKNYLESRGYELIVSLGYDHIYKKC